MSASVSRALYDEVGRVALRMGYALAEHTPGGSAATPRLPLDGLLRRLADLELQSGDADIGLRIGRLLGPTALGIPGYLAMAGPTLLDALPRVMSYQRLVADGIEMRFSVEADDVRFRIDHREQVPGRALADLLVAGTRFFGAWLLGSEPPLSDVWFRYARPARTALHEEIFGCTPRFGCSDDGFTLARTWFDETLRTAEASLVPVLEAQATRQLAGLREDAFLATASTAIVELISSGEQIEMALVASRLHASPRTLQRRLQAHGTTFNRLVQEVRMEMAHRLLADRRLTLHQVALLLGYHEQSSFCHAYRQWTGRAPSEARRVAAPA